MQCAFCSRSNRVSSEITYQKNLDCPTRKLNVSRNMKNRHAWRNALTWFRYKNTSASVFASSLFVFSRFLRNRIYTLSFIVWWARAHQNAEYSCGWESFRMDFSIEFLRGRENTRRRNGGIILSLARWSGCETFIRAKGVAHEMRFVHTLGVSCVDNRMYNTYVYAYRIDRRACASRDVHLAVGNLRTRATWRRVASGRRRRPKLPGGPRNPPRCVVPGQIIIYWTAIVFRACECYRRGLPRGRSET